MHLIISEEDRLCICFRFDEISSKYTAMPIRLIPTARIASKFFLPAMQHLRRQQVRYMTYINDVCRLVHSSRKSPRDAQFVVNLLHKIRFGIQTDKVLLDLIHSLQILGTSQQCADAV